MCIANMIKKHCLKVNNSLCDVGPYTGYTTCTISHFTNILFPEIRHSDLRQQAEVRHINDGRLKSSSSSHPLCPHLNQ
jgi:hypothetical protein